MNTDVACTFTTMNRSTASAALIPAEVDQAIIASAMGALEWLY